MHETGLKKNRIQDTTSAMNCFGHNHWSKINKPGTTVCDNKRNNEGPTRVINTS